ncbi:hypothetical protein [Actinomadura madurae]|uniref:hypothetical protein n=1 Tax=Actinomadura madurae TaxID=1993 RepID=UPI002026B378|nr:hypothetical protein [Actinomadura madurae]MCP9949634.1 hypothetical protein [Actinomadura madurae]MCP9966387.1 hypothetical protein [Actinomadura madurae]MCP9978876.1 hypothetical protein [Actinomadura madurae]MCQ0009596.1 hypothetical protein [Actinomadura madurae]MCQ0015064.1 hypothetical protein [Actinomadura madurae]
MTDQSATAVYPAGPADLFVRLYDAIADDVFQGWTATRWARRERVRRDADEIAETVLEDGVLDPAVTAEIVAEHGDLGRFTLLLGLDVALAHASPYSPTTTRPRSPECSSPT